MKGELINGENSPDHTILNWIAILVENRLFSIKTPVARRAKQYLIDHCSINVNAFDLIIGYRADDSYFDYVISVCGIPGCDFVKLFAISSASKRMENGEPTYISGKSSIEVAVQIIGEAKGIEIDIEPQ